MSGKKEILGPGQIARWSPAHQAYVITPFNEAWSEEVLRAAPVLAVKTTEAEAREFMGLPGRSKATRRSKAASDQRGVKPGHYLDVHGREVKKKAPKKSSSPPTQRKISTMSGYGYHFTGSKNPLTSKDDDWEIKSIDAMVGQLVGKRQIDGSDCYVIRVGDKYYAQTVVSLR